MTVFKDDANFVTKGDLKLKSNYVLEVRLLDMIIYSKVRASMTDLSYKVELIVEWFRPNCKGSLVVLGEIGYADT